MPLIRARIAQRRRTNTQLARDVFVRDFLKQYAPQRRRLLRELESNGPLLSREFCTSSRTPPADRYEDHRWWGSRPSRLMLDILAVRGEIAVAGRVGKQRLWDLGDRVFPPSETLPWREADASLRGAGSARSASGRRKAAGRSTPTSRTNRCRPRHRPLPLRPAHPRSRPRRVPVELPLPPRDVRAEGEA